MQPSQSQYFDATDVLFTNSIVAFSCSESETTIIKLNQRAMQPDLSNWKWTGPMISQKHFHSSTNRLLIKSKKSCVGKDFLLEKCEIKPRRIPRKFLMPHHQSKRGRIRKEISAIVSNQLTKLIAPWRIKSNSQTRCTTHVVPTN
jgi:hypothetical protein